MKNLSGEGIPMWKDDGAGGKYISIDFQYIAPFGNGKYTECTRSVAINPYLGKMKLQDLSVRPLFELEVNEHVKRGGKFKELTQRPTYMHANGYMYVPVWGGGMKRLLINSRVVIDPEGYKKYQSADRWHSNHILNVIPDELCHSTHPCLPVFSVEYRTWGEVPVNSISEINFDETAFNRIVLPQQTKDIVSTLVINFYKTECCDFIVGKKRGLIFLLNGPPGVGKTLTAHGIAELTHRPLYVIGSGDIGTEPSEIDKKLEKIFTMVGNWNGIVLIDEADVFMSKRTDYELNYNACVSVFLRLIETYYGILFLTTNREQQIDDAIRSRIHVALKYYELSDAGMALVWRESFQRYKIKDIDLDKLKCHKLNNREIANIVQLAYISSGGNPENVTQELIENFVKLRKEFVAK